MDRVQVAAETIEFEEYRAQVRHYPSSDAIGNWLRRYGGTDGEVRLWTVISSLIQTLTGGSGLVLEIDSTTIKADKDNAQPTFRSFREYHSSSKMSTTGSLVRLTLRLFAKCPISLENQQFPNPPVHHPTLQSP